MKIDANVLSQFTGTEKYHRGYCGVLYTDGIKYLMDNGLGWLITDISSYQIKEDIKKIPFQIWTLKVNDDKTAVLTMKEDANEPILITQEYKYIDYSLKEVALWLIDGILILPSEY